MSMELRVKRRVPEAQLPTRTSEGAAGYDLYSCQDCTIPAQGKVRSCSSLLAFLWNNLNNWHLVGNSQKGKGGY